MTKQTGNQDQPNRADKARADKARDEAERTKRAVDSMGLGNTPHGGDDPQHGNNSNLAQTPLPSDTGGKGHVGDTPVKDQA
ncbi:hypothetical protein [Azospirillum agricola]|uniref:hypothetical protein n=1 Tax=Azospirillum agricola TaxID=1720247 RepID=UPI000A0EF1B4|nr:hypothetical protein [Azospirillum agricola]SMH45821.1 hypothetical protein SAMN02982994_2297 [Azospirillum lipoferum]